jgi:hypothetical protein
MTLVTFLLKLTLTSRLFAGPDDRREIRSGPSTIRLGKKQARNATTGLSYPPEEVDGTWL